MTTEIWKPVVGYEGYYEVSNMGKVKRLPKNNVVNERILKLHTNNHNGYVYASLSKDNKKYTKRVHIMVMEAFSDYRSAGYDPYKQLDHINGDKTDNRLENLEIVTQAENTRRAREMKPYKVCSKKVICLDTGEVFDSMTDAVRSVGGHKVGSITRVCQGTRSQYRNKHFAYYDDYLNNTIPAFKGRAKESCEKLWVK